MNDQLVAGPNHAVTSDEIQLSASKLESVLFEMIQARVRARVRDIEVSRINETVVVRGKVDSYHVFQIALVVCQQVLSGRFDLSLDCQLQVKPCADTQIARPQ